jgi:hypothetical protein
MATNLLVLHLFPYALWYQSDSVTYLLCVLTVCFVYPGPIPAELGQLANLQELALSNNKLTGTPHSLPDLHAVWREMLAFNMPFRTSRIGWLVYCMFWPSFYQTLFGWLVCCCEFRLHFVVLLFCCSLAGTVEAKQALQAEIPNCNISIGQYED